MIEANARVILHADRCTIEPGTEQGIDDLDMSRGEVVLGAFPYPSRSRGPEFTLYGTPAEIVEFATGLVGMLDDLAPGWAEATS
jgi:hypothetical protein